ncbi:MAG: outer membrane beta-barrel domain-containing protein [Pseudomonadota bacterium]|nr:outer membrane beta-barrel domain-containing protein [Pseudomonadota bacterium]
MLTLLLASLALAPLVLAEAPPVTGPVDVGVLKNSDIRVVQKVLYTKEDRLELGVSLGVMPFDGYTVAPAVLGSGTMHLSEKVGVELQVGGGYGLKNGVYTQLESATYGVAVEAYRYLASVEAALQYTPIYAKMNLGNGTILHHDVYGLVGVGGTLEQSVFPSAEITIAPTLPIGIGTRIFVGPNTALKFELRDNVMAEYRAQSKTWGLKQNVAISAGLSFFGTAKK